MKKLVILSSRFPYPLEKGDKLRLYHQIKSLSKHFDIHLLSIVETVPLQGIAQAVTQYCKGFKYYKLSKPKQAIGLAGNIFRKLPFQVRYFYDKETKEKITKEIESINPDVVYCQLIRMVPYTVGLNYPMVLDYMDAFSLIMNRRYENTSSAFKKWMYKLEAERLERYESQVQDQFSVKTVISDKDRVALSSTQGLEIISNGVDTSYYNLAQLSKDYDLLFAGNMGYHPNVSAAKYLVNEIVSDKNMKVLIAGARPTHEVEKLASENVTVSGWVEDIRQSYHRSKIFVAPLFQGAGQQNKILQAMAMGVPCITTTIVNDAIGAKHGEEIMIANNVEEFRSHIETLLKDKALSHQIAKQARTFVENQHNWKQQGEKLVSLIQNVT